MNENIVIITLVIASFACAYFGVDDGAMIRMVITAVLGYLCGTRSGGRRKW